MHTCTSHLIQLFSRFAFFSVAIFICLHSVSGHTAGILISSARIWPAQEYTRITLEASSAIQHSLFSVQNPERLVLDLQDATSSGALENLVAKVSADDPYIKSIRVGRYKPGVIRVVLDLKSKVRSDIFVLKPVGEYGYRLVLDIYPEQPVDPILALLQKPEFKQDPSDTSIEAKAQNDLSKPKAGGEAEKEQIPNEKPNQRTDKTKKSPEVIRLITVAIDAGHGGEDPGALGKQGTHEKDVTLAIAKRLKAAVDAEPNMRGVLIREGDYFIPLHGRVGKARKLRADLFVSIHADSFVRPDARGSSVFALSERGATSAAARWLAKKENEADLIGGVNLDVPDPYLKQTLLDLSQTATINDSIKLAKAVLSNLGEINTLHKPAVEQAGFAVLKSPDIPSILVETAFISNPHEEKKLNDVAYQQKIAEAILAGIRKYFAQNPPVARSKLARND